MKSRILTAIFTFALLIGGCQAAGPGIQVLVVAQPKAGYTAPEPNDVGYGGSDNPDVASKHDHNFHLIDYRALDNVVVWLEPVGAVTTRTPPLGADVNVSASNPNAVFIASSGGRVAFKSSLKTGSFILRGRSGELIDVPASKPNFVAMKPGVFDVLVDDRDDAVATLVVSPTPWVKKTTSNRPVTFSPIPTGGYRVFAWHPVLPGANQAVDVSTGDLTKLTLTVGVNSLPKPK